MGRYPLSPAGIFKPHRWSRPRYASIPRRCLEVHDLRTTRQLTRTEVSTMIPRFQHIFQCLHGTGLFVQSLANFHSTAQYKTVNLHNNYFAAEGPPPVMERRVCSTNKREPCAIVFGFVDIHGHHLALTMLAGIHGAVCTAVKHGGYCWYLPTYQR